MDKISGNKDHFLSYQGLMTEHLSSNGGRIFNKKESSMDKTGNYYLSNSASQINLVSREVHYNGSFQKNYESLDSLLFDTVQKTVLLSTQVRSLKAGEDQNFRQEFLFKLSCVTE